MLDNQLSESGCRRHSDVSGRSRPAACCSPWRETGSLILILCLQLFKHITLIYVSVHTGTPMHVSAGRGQRQLWNWVFLPSGFQRQLLSSVRLGSEHPHLLSHRTSPAPPLLKCQVSQEASNQQRSQGRPRTSNPPDSSSDYGCPTIPGFWASGNRTQGMVYTRL